ncbi:hypothetical protein NP233_g6302 [Leucocoprinus birnbaumii]|uniref:Auxin efflux carrier n=1 Tax=Leucocoprinus birnbaumii TaxID=56174 RepID=A0AAD5YQ48_9AGAR|nr:hypothetical protein NP233_g6302 [Leucocoprinus birnbaumii]
MSSASIIAISGALQGSLSVIITILYGVAAARFNIVSPTTTRDVSRLCADILLPALLFTSIGKNLSFSQLLLYLPIVLWSLVCILISTILGKLAARWLKLPSWIVALSTFNNSTSLPILLTQIFAETGILSRIAGADVDAAVERATTFYLVNSLVAKIATFTVGPSLFDQNSLTSKESKSETPFTTTPSPEMSEVSALLPKHRVSTKIPSTSIRRRFRSFSPVTWSAILATGIGLYPPLHRLFFSPQEEGGYFSVSISGSLSNIGRLFASLQTLIVGAKLSRSFERHSNQESSNPPAKALIVILVIRFVLWSFISVPFIYCLALYTDLLPADPVMWWCMILIPVGPPAMTLSTLVDVINVGESDKNMVARTLAFMYGVTPVMSLAVVAALKACVVVMEKKGMAY